MDDMKERSYVLDDKTRPVILRPLILRPSTHIVPSIKRACRRDFSEGCESSEAEDCLHAHLLTRPLPTPNSSLLTPHSALLTANWLLLRGLTERAYITSASVRGCHL